MIALLLALACSDAPRFERDLADAFSADCVGCHAGDTPQGDLDLSGDLYTALVDQPSNQSDLLLVEPGDALYSYLFHKLNGSQGLAEGAGSTMPLSGPWPDDQLELVAAWIDGGAKR